MLVVKKFWSEGELFVRALNKNRDVMIKNFKGKKIWIRSKYVGWFHYDTLLIVRLVASVAKISKECLDYICVYVCVCVCVCVWMYKGICRIGGCCKYEGSGRCFFK